ncbi:MAG: dynamin family protein [Komarekiella atlantica HA4396-MV6]|jgi:GTPase Era involved in 16S rRNA processing|nr:dynamin family protein [Komarekiella atlantica HA4396-MV6]
MSSEQFQAAHDSIYNAGTNLLQYLQEIRQSRLSEGDETKGLQGVEVEINKALHALKEKEYQVAVIAAMKAGKSTFLNAVIGADILASETAACTICRTEVRHIPSGQISRLLEYRDGQRQPFLIAEGDAGKIQQKFLERTREIREKGNSDNTISFKIEHPIEAIGTLSSLAGFTLVDTPGPNEWESANFDVKLKQTTLEALRNCNAILFVLNYASYKDNAISDLFKDVIENRKEILTENTGKIYFILNKVDQKTEKDKEIADVIKDLKLELTSFGFPNPIIYPASSRQGLLAKLIQKENATESQISDFEDFFSAKYAERDARGRKVIPLPSEIAPKALKDSGLPTIQETVIETITQNAGWNLLSDALAKIDKAAKTIENSLNTQFSGWDITIESLKIQVENYRRHSEFAKTKVETVKKSVEKQKQILIKGFIQGVSIFAYEAKDKIQHEIDQIAQSRVGKSTKHNIKQSNNLQSQVHQDVDWFGIAGEIGGTLLELIPGIGKVLGKGLKTVLKTSNSLLDSMRQSVPDSLNISDSEYDNLPDISDSYIIRAKTKAEAQKIGSTINDFCAPHIQSWWLDTQDKLVRDGTKIREALVNKIQEDIQQISNELSEYLGQSLHVHINVNDIQFPSFEFSGIDAKIQYQQEVFTRTRKEAKRDSGCCKSDKVYYVDVSYEDKHEFYEIDLRQTIKLIKQKIDEQVSRNEQLLQRVIEKQVEEDFRSAEQQINDYIKTFQDDFDRLLKERKMREAEADQIREILNIHKDKLNKYLCELTAIRVSLSNWKPA